MRSDVYSLGVLLYEMLTGYVPIEVHGLTDLRKIQRDPPVPIGELARRRADPGRAPGRDHAVPREGRRRSVRSSTRSSRSSSGSRTASTPARNSRCRRSRTDARRDRPKARRPPMPRRCRRARGRGAVRRSSRRETRSAASRSASGSAAAAWASCTSRGTRSSQREVAIKVATRVEEEKARRAILREARASSHLQVREHRHDLRRRHRGGLPVHRDGVRARPDARRRSSRPRARSRGERFWSLARGILDGLIYAHEGEKPVIHRDLKPANILCAGDVAKIADFGIATVTAGAAPHDEARATCDTRAGPAPRAAC